ncbi:MAG TPA: hypothetical protein PLV42_07205 [bacterium]|nr:hypothetical protein [bacterium]
MAEKQSIFWKHYEENDGDVKMIDMYKAVPNTYPTGFPLYAEIEDREGATGTKADWAKKDLKNELTEIERDCFLPNWDGYGAQPVGRETIEQAWKFLKAIPPQLPRPSIGVESDGHITFEWYRSPRYVISISVSSDGRIYFASLMGNKTQRGRDIFFGELPGHIKQIILDVIH